MSDEATIRTALYVQEPSTVTIVAKDPRDAKAQLYRYNKGAVQPAVGTHKLQRGIYMILSKAEMSITNPNVMTVVVPREKDGWPDFTESIVALEQGADAASIQAFFQVAKDITKDEPEPDELHDD
jgi:hypothetical protein